ncbi:MAG: hypothetical protein M3126_10140 [Candidatus Eremiobacteraeota bacterium]|nr:hypothetical protein [Candidatus Eremiobacteraeota bacterium]
MKRKPRSHQGLRLFSRLAVATMSLIVFALVGIQFAHIIDRNVAMGDSLHDVQSDVRVLHMRKLEQERELRRLSDPTGSIPEIHDRLHLVGPHETIIYLKAPAPPSSP